MTAAPTTDDNFDAQADEIILKCLDLDAPLSFFLYAGAGSGKTRSLVKALNGFRSAFGAKLRLKGQRAGVITYTNAACDEIKRRLDYDPAIVVETIHSFAWHLIEGLNQDIRAWLRTDIANDIVQLEAQQAKGRPNSKAFQDRIVELASKQRRLERLDSILTFKYDPNGDNRGQGSLSHSDVIKIAASFLTTKPKLQQILVGKFPVMLVDESQDTLRPFMEALLRVQADRKTKFSLGLLGDTMQRIYADGKDDLAAAIPEDWQRPIKAMNHRCPKRVVSLINRIRSEDDGQEQRARTDKAEGWVRLFVVPQGSKSVTSPEQKAAERMVEITNDDKWAENGGVKTLILEHHMAARRMGFLPMYEALSTESSFQTSLMQGSLSSVNLFSQQVLPLVAASKQNDKFAVASLLRNASPLLSRKAFKNAKGRQMEQLQRARDAVASLLALWSGNGSPKFIDVLRNVTESGLFEIPEPLKAISERSAELQALALDLGELGDDPEAKRRVALDQFLDTEFAQIGPYAEYVGHAAQFDTHQGVKGLEFPRVMVVIDDSETRGFMFKYDKLFGVAELSDRDLENEREGKDTSVRRARRLFYVTCSRAEEGLAIVAHSADPAALQARVIDAKWFEPGEIEILQ